MTRVSENSQSASLKFSINKAKSRMENLQLKGSTLKSVSKPSDNPVGNVEAMQLTSNINDNKQYVRNANYALMHLNVTEKALEEISNILNKAKEIAIAQSSDLYNGDVRRNIANEVVQLKNLALSIANKRVGQKYLFGGYKTLERPFDKLGNYSGDKGHISLEVSKDFFIPINVNGHEVFFANDDTSQKRGNPLKELNPSPGPSKTEQPNEPSKIPETIRGPASVESNKSDNFEKRENIFALLDNLTSGLENNEPNVIQDLLEKIDSANSRVITLRTRIGSNVNSIESSKMTIEAENIDNADRRSSIVDADVAELFSDLTKQQDVLKTTYKTTQNLLNQNLLDFLR